MGSSWEIFFVILGMSMWILFPIGMFLSVGQVDKNTDQIVQLDHLRHDSEPLIQKALLHKRFKSSKRSFFHWPAFMQRWIHH